MGLYPAGGGIERTFFNVEPAIRDRLRVLWKTPAYTPHAFAAHPRISSETVERIETAMMAMNEGEAGLRLLAALNFAGIESAEDSDWDDVRALRIGLLDGLVQPGN